MRAKAATGIPLVILASMLVGVTLYPGCVPGEEVYTYAIPKAFPAMDIPEDNAPAELRVEIGRRLFFDPRMSVDTSLSCASCHRPEFAFADTVAKSPGVHGHQTYRNTPSLINIGWHPYFMRDGGIPHLEMQPLAAVGDPDEMGFNMAALVNRLQEDPDYVRMFEEAYGRDDAFAVTRSLAAFQRSLIQYGNRDESGELSAGEEQGKAIFIEHCVDCHGGFDYTNYSLENNGLYAVYEYDTGRARITRTPEDVGKFKVPSLRNVSVTAPYMHDGSLSSLEEVVEHYSRGGAGHPLQSEKIKPLGLTVEERVRLVAYLKAL